VIASGLWIPAYVGLGSNLNEPEKQVREAVAHLADIPQTRLELVSELYGNPPMGPQDQPDYVNAVAGLLTQLSSQELLEALQNLENSLGRTRSAGDRWGPRVIDLDLLVFGREQKSDPGLNLPHPGISERNFVLFPLRDIASRLVVPGKGTVEVMAQHISDAGLHRLSS